jgi:lysophospholipase L1-like esterase
MKSIEKNELIWNGRYLDYEGVRYFDYSASGFCFVMKGRRAEAVILSDPDSWNEENKAVLGIFVTDGDDTSIKAIPEEPTQRVTLRERETRITLFESDVEKTVCIRVMKFSEAAFGYAGLKALEIDGEMKVVEPVDTSVNRPLKLEFIGDSITCGYGIEGVWEKDTFTTQQERPDKAYAFLTAKALGAQIQLCSWSGIGLISNYVDPETVNLPDTHWLMQANWPYTDKSLSLRLGLEPEVWDGSRYEPDVLVIHLGTNDLSWVRGLEERRLEYVAQLRQLIEAVHRRSPKAKIVCCLGLMGEALNDSVREAVELFKKDFPKTCAEFLPFTQQLESDGIAADWHPSAVTHKKAANKLVAVIPNLFRDPSDRC